MNMTRLIAAANLIFIFAPTVSLTSEGSELKEIMQGLRNDLVDISDGLLMDDFEQIARGATAIAQHPQIPSEQVQLVAAELGPEMAAFKQLDNLVHDLSVEISAAAALVDRDAVISGYQGLIEACLACHSTYIKRVASVLGQANDTDIPNDS